MSDQTPENKQGNQNPPADQTVAKASPPAPVPAQAKVAPAGAAAAHAAAPPPAVPSEPGQFGQFLQEHGIASKRLADSSGCETIHLEADNLVAAIKRLRNSPETQLNFLVTISGVDTAEAFESVYHLRSYVNNNELVIKVLVPKASIPEGQLPMVPSITPIWEAANWHERETYDLVGIRYVGHPYLRRILNPWDWEGHPLRRDYKQVVDALNDKARESFR